MLTGAWEASLRATPILTSPHVSSRVLTYAGKDADVC
jgi:hypothetical protein